MSNRGPIETGASLRQPGERPAGLVPPAHLSKSPPIPAPAPIAPPADPLDPTRYGDWELRGIAIDF